jgi:hypothetical protein
LADQQKEKGSGYEQNEWRFRDEKRENQKVDDDSNEMPPVGSRPLVCAFGRVQSVDNYVQALPNLPASRLLDRFFQVVQYPILVTPVFLEVAHKESTLSTVAVFKASEVFVAGDSVLDGGLSKSVTTAEGGLEFDPITTLGHQKPDNAEHTQEKM